ncbi:MAG: 4Fe-4S dicluster domain-containing protein [Actinobacteria bacterium]|nr:4Fe-4S dicluster domain-containing protein [Actinomycetota bacterium]
MTYKKIYHKNPEACTGCMVCGLVCSLRFEKNGINPERSAIKIINDPEKGIFTPNVCIQCDDAPCIEACSSGALSKDPGTGAIVVDGEDCTGCELCVDSCKFDAIFMHPELKIARICDLCKGEPLCVKYCMQEALLFVSLKDYGRKTGEKIKKMSYA